MAAKKGDAESCAYFFFFRNRLNARTPPPATNRTELTGSGATGADWLRKTPEAEFQLIRSSETFNPIRTVLTESD
ncbi:MAG: hypothetical protein OEU95_09285, partial [Nitrospirota bacterium]|nr:hypothetical protein [Nitrospirota bacterium]